MSDCIQWHKAYNPAGYGRAWDPALKKTVQAHRLIWEQQVGPIPKNMTIDHLCRNVGCVNVEHMEVVTLQENLARGPNYHKNQYTDATHCRRGHPFDETNTYNRPDGKRTCKECQSDRSREYYQRKRQDVYLSQRDSGDR